MTSVWPCHANARERRWALVLASCLCAAASTVGAQTVGGASRPEIYSCVDAKGRTLTADRPIAECKDRSQRMLNPSGTTKATVGPALSPNEQEWADKTQKQAKDQQAQRDDQRRRDRALLQRYPSLAVFEQERARVLAQDDSALGVAEQRLQTLRAGATDAQGLGSPPEDHPAQMMAQEQVVRQLQAERARKRARFDEDLNRLKPLWLQPAEDLNSLPASRAAGR